MTLSEVKETLQAELLTPDSDLSLEVRSACASDMMSDVLAFAEPRSLIITGLVNQQTLRTVEIADALAVVFVRGKRPDHELISTAAIKKIPLLATKYCMHDACGLLFSSGLCGVTAKVENRMRNNGNR